MEAFGKSAHPLSWKKNIFLVILCKIRGQSTRPSLTSNISFKSGYTKTTFSLDNALQGLIQPTESSYALGYGLLWWRNTD